MTRPSATAVRMVGALGNRREAAADCQPHGPRLPHRRRRPAPSAPTSRRPPGSARLPLRRPGAAPDQPAAAVRPPRRPNDSNPWVVGVGATAARLARRDDAGSAARSARPGRSSASGHRGRSAPPGSDRPRCRRRRVVVLPREHADRVGWVGPVWACRCLCSPRRRPGRDAVLATTNAAVAVAVTHFLMKPPFRCYQAMWPDCPPVAAAPPGSLIKKFREAHSSPVFTLPATAPANQPNPARRCGGGLLDHVEVMWRPCGGLLPAPLDGFLRDYRRCRCHRPRGPARMRGHRSQADAARATIPSGSRSPPLHGVARASQPLAEPRRSAVKSAARAAAEYQADRQPGAWQYTTR